MQLLTSYLSLLPSQGHPGLSHCMMAFFNSIVAALSPKQSDSKKSVWHPGQIIFVLLLNRNENKNQ